MKRLLFSILFFFSIYCASAMYNVRDFGATGQPEVNVTSCIQAALDSAGRNGGGVVFFPEGEYLCSTLEIHSGTTLLLSTGATLLASNKEDDYPRTFTLADTGGGGVPMLLFARNASHISIQGGGTIKGQPEYVMQPLSYSSFIDEDWQAAVEAGVEMTVSRWKKPNVSLVFFSECTDVTIRDVQLIDSPFWTLHLHWCEGVRINGLQIRSQFAVAANSDGIDIDGCRDVTVSDCIIATADDCICLKSTLSDRGYRSCERVNVHGCILSTSSCALKLGTESHGDFRQILFSDCIIHDANRALGIFIRDGGHVEDVTFSNMDIHTTRYPVGWWGSADAFRFVVLKRRDNSPVGSIRNLTLENIWAVCQGSNRLAGWNSEQPMENVVLRHVSLTMQAEPTVDKRTREGLSLTHVRGLTLDDVQVNWTGIPQTTWTHGLILDDAPCSVKGVKITGQPRGYKAISIRK